MLPNASNLHTSPSTKCSIIVSNDLVVEHCDFPRPLYRAQMAYIFAAPQSAPFPRTCFWSNSSQWLRHLGPAGVLNYPPRKEVPTLQISLNQAFLECCNLCLSREPLLGWFVHSCFEIKVLKVCSTIRRRKKVPISQIVLDEANLECPNLYHSPEPLSWSNWPQRLQHLGRPGVLNHPPQIKEFIFQVSLNKTYLKCLNLYLLPAPPFGQIGHDGLEI